MVIYDANNGTQAQRQRLAEKFDKDGIHVVMLGSIAIHSVDIPESDTSHVQSPCVMIIRSLSVTSEASKSLLRMCVHSSHKFAHWLRSSPVQRLGSRQGGQRLLWTHQRSRRTL